jgi:hypothetical protein
MLATKPRHDGPTPRYNLAAATTEMMWACALATTRAAVASTARGLALWSHMLRAPVGPPWTFLAGPTARAGHVSPADAAPGAPTDTCANTPGEPSAFASYRSAGGHAAAQVKMGR